MTPRRRFTSRTEPTRCKCEGGADRAKEHGKPGAKAADHGNPFKCTGACGHSQLQHTTRGQPKKRTVKKLRLDRNALEPRTPRDEGELYLGEDTRP